MISEWEMANQKQCYKCKKIKPFSEFAISKDQYGFMSQCKECRKQYAAKYYELNIKKLFEKEREYGKKYYEKSKNSFPEKLEEKRFCAICNNELSIAQIRQNCIYCSKKCMGKACRRPSAYLNEGFRGYDWNLKRTIIRERDNYTCQICGVLENGREHDVHHIISYHAFKDKKIANREDNLITLCGKCHGKYDETEDYIPIFRKKICGCSK